MRILLEEQKAQKVDRFLRGRQIAYMIYDYFWVTGTHESILDFTDLMNVTQRGDDIQGFDASWDEVLLSIEEMPQDHIVESLHKRRIRDSEQLKTILALYDQDNEQKKAQPSCSRLKNMVKKFLDQKVSKSENLRPETTELFQKHQHNREAGRQVVIVNEEIAFRGQPMANVPREAHDVLSTT